MADRRARAGLPIDLPGGDASPLRKILSRLAIALALIALVAGRTKRARFRDPSTTRSCSPSSATAR